MPDSLGASALRYDVRLLHDPYRTSRTAQPLRDLKAGELYSLTVWIKDPAAVPSTAEIGVEVDDASGAVVQKTLHEGDLDLYLTLRPRANGSGAVKFHWNEAAAKLDVGVDLRPIRTARDAAVAIAAQPNGTWQDAQEFRYGQIIYGSSDERPYSPAASEDTYQALLKGFQWFKFTFTGTSPRLVYFVLNVLDRDVPPDVDIYTATATDVAPYTEGAFLYKPEATQNFPGLYKFSDDGYALGGGVLLHARSWDSRFVPFGATLERLPG